MTKLDHHSNLRDKVLRGLNKAYERLIEYKRQKNSVLVVLKDNKIVRVKP